MRSGSRSRGGLTRRKGHAKWHSVPFWPPRRTGQGGISIRRGRRRHGRYLRWTAWLTPGWHAPARLVVCSGWRVLPRQSSARCPKLAKRVQEPHRQPFQFLKKSSFQVGRGEKPKSPMCRAFDYAKVWRIFWSRARRQWDETARDKEYELRNIAQRGSKTHTTWVGINRQLAPIGSINETSFAVTCKINWSAHETY